MSYEATIAKRADALHWVLVSMRPNQWLKNSFVFAALLFSKNIFHSAQVATSVLAFGVFCLASGAVYLLNDLVDREQDRRHPKKRLRPLASGALDPGTGTQAFVVLLAVALLTGYLVNTAFFLMVSAYVALQVAYCAVLKRIILLDVFAIAAGFFLRVAAGSVAIEVPMSKWLLICTIFISLFLALAKRRQELLSLGDGAGDHRKVLDEYNVRFLDQMVSIATTGTIVSYSLYTLSEETIAKFGTAQLWLTVPIVLYGISRYLYTVYKQDGGGAPEEIVWRDKPLLACLALYLVSTLLIVYLHSGSLA